MPRQNFLAKESFVNASEALTRESILSSATSMIRESIVSVDSFYLDTNPNVPLSPNIRTSVYLPHPDNRKLPISPHYETLKVELPIIIAGFPFEPEQSAQEELPQYQVFEETDV